MRIEFLNAGLLGLAALALVPLLLHLFARTRPPVYEFSSVEFLRKIVRKTMRLKKPQDAILLALRTLLFLALIGVFLRPLLFSQQKLTGLLEQKNVVVLVDASASMAAVEGAQTRFASACAEASEVLSGLTARDRADLIWIDAEPDAVFGELGVNFGFLKDSLRRARVTSERGAAGKAFQLALQLLEQTDGKREICVVSDFQTTGWREFEPIVPDTVDLVFLKVGRDDLPNLAVTGLAWEPEAPIVGEEVTMLGEIRNFSREDQTTTVFCSAGENRQSRNLPIVAGETANVVFRHRVTEAGAIPVTLSVAEDAFPDDDSRFQAIPARNFLSVGVFSGRELETAQIWRGAADALEWAWASELNADELSGDLEQFDAILLAGWNGESLGKVAPGAKLIVLPGAGADLADVAALLGVEATSQALAKRDLSLPQLKSIRSLRLAAENDPIFALFAQGAHGDLTAGTVDERLEIPADALPGTRLLEFGDGVPGLVRVAEGRYLWNLPLAAKSGHWAGRVEFLPFFGELLLHGRSGGLALLDYEPGEVLVWTPEENIDAGELELSRTNDAPVAVESRGGREFFSAPVPAPGLYAWNLRGAPVHLSAVNFPAEESDLGSMALQDVQAQGAATVRGGADVRFLRDGMKLWPLLLALGIACLFLEAGVLVWTSRTP